MAKHGIVEIRGDLLQHELLFGYIIKKDIIMEKVYSIYTMAMFYELSEVCVSIMYGLFRSPSICESPSMIYKVIDGIPEDKRNVQCNVFAMLYCFVSYYWKHSTNKAIKEFIHNTPNLNIKTLASMLDVFAHAGMSSIDALACIKLITIRYENEGRLMMKRVVSDIHKHNKGYFNPAQYEELKSMNYLDDHDHEQAMEISIPITDVDRVGVKSFFANGLSTVHMIKSHKQVVFELKKDKEERIKLSVESRLEISKIYVYVTGGSKSMYKEFYKFDQEPGVYELCTFADLKELGEKLEIRIVIGRVSLSDIKQIKPHQYIVKYISSTRKSENNPNIKALYCYGDNGPVLSFDDSRILEIIVARCNKAS